ncbi:MAG: hypothetical protein J7K17_00460 [Candidatus Omnitrophica bacterium]|nr:hypothetical protein [Candidatus Omnitrophota bacterium]
MLSSLSPCAYPLIPITLGIIGVYTISSKSKGLKRNILYGAVNLFFFSLGYGVILWY